MNLPWNSELEKISKLTFDGRQWNAPAKKSIKGTFLESILTGKARRSKRAKLPNGSRLLQNRTRPWSIH